MEYKILLVIIFAFLSQRECSACFTRNETNDETGLRKTGSSFYIQCECTDPQLSIKNLQWLDIHDNTIEEMGPGTEPNVYTVRNHRTLSLHIHSLSKSLSGYYKCVSRDESNGQIYARSYFVGAYDPMFYVNTNDTQYLIKGSDSTIICEARGDSQPLISWQKRDDEFVYISDNEKYELTSAGLVVKNVTDEDAGIYVCEAFVPQTGENNDKDIVVEVLTAPTIEKLAAYPNDTVLVGDTLSIECNARGFPLPKYTWKKISETPTAEDVILSWMDDESVLIFENATLEDEGTYQCIANSAAGEVMEQIVIQVFTPPNITWFANVTANEGSITQVICKASGRPRPEINMLYEDNRLEEDNSITYDERKTNEMETTFHLNFSKVKRHHEGYFYCNASNAVDTVSQEMYLTVLYKPTFNVSQETVYAWEGKAVDLFCDYESQPDCIVEWSYQGNGNYIPLANETELQHDLIAQLHGEADPVLRLPEKKKLYGIYECKASNTLGEDRKKFNVLEGKVPSLVQNVIVSNTATSATFSISGPDNAGPPVTGYTAEYDIKANYDVMSIHFNRTWAFGIEYRLDKLKPNTEYQIKFAALNDVGVGPFSEYFQFETPAKSAPEAPSLEDASSFVEVPADNRILKLKSAEDNGDLIDFYAVKYCAGDSDECVEQRVSPTTELELTHLDHNKTYHLEIVAHNSVGNSTPTSVSVHIAEALMKEEMVLSSGAIITISVVVVVVCIVLLDVLLFITRRKGFIASCFFKKDKKHKEENVQSRDRKGLLKENGDTTDGTLKSADNGHKEFEYNKTTGQITGKHSAV